MSEQLQKEEQRLLDIVSYHQFSNLLSKICDDEMFG